MHSFCSIYDFIILVLFLSAYILSPQGILILHTYQLIHEKLVFNLLYYSNNTFPTIAPFSWCSWTAQNIPIA